MTIGELVSNTGARMRVFDLGRRIEEIPESVFSAFEQQAAPWPVPYLKHAWIGILSWNPKQPGQHNIWFIKLPLDEQNVLQPGPRDAFVQHCLRVAAAPDKKHGDAPCSYRPDPSRMAYFHALALRALGQPVTQFYATARAYLSGDIGWANWQQLGLQGLAEVVARLDDDHNSQLLANALPFLPAVPRNALLNFLENARPDQALTSAINDVLSTVVGKGAEVSDLAAFARALSNCVNQGQRCALLQVLLAHPHRLEVELLAAIGSRCWQDLDGPLLQQYLECLAANVQGEGAFNALVADILALPGMRVRFMNLLASGDLSEQLNKAVARLFSLARSGQGNLQ